MAKSTDVDQLSYLNNLIENDGEVALGRYGPAWGAIASDRDVCYAMLVRKQGESLSQLLVRLDTAIKLAVEEDEFTDEINPD